MSIIGTITTTGTNISGNPNNYGWICPKCGQVMAPWYPTCTKCSGNPTITKPYIGDDDWWKKQDDNWWTRPNATWEIPIHDYQITL